MSKNTKSQKQIVINFTRPHKAHLESIYNASAKITYRIVSSTRVNGCHHLLRFHDDQNCNLLHCGGSLVENKKSWIAETGDGLSYFLIDHGKRRQAKKLLRSSYCKQIIAWSKQAYQNAQCFSKDVLIADKIEMLYPAIRIRHQQKHFSLSQKTPIKLLFIGNSFMRKGGEILLDAFDLLKKDFNIHLTIFSNFFDFDIPFF